MHIHMTAQLNCTFAQGHCKAYTSLSIVASNEALQMLKEAAGGTYGHSWIYSQENSCKSLKYEDTTTSSVNYLFINHSHCAITHNGHWNSISSSNTYPFFCYVNFILVQENKTWEEALKYCRSNYTDLVYFNFPWPVNQIKSETNNAQTDRVWTGLRFLNGAWNWLNKANVPASTFSLPSCPPEPNRCGARNIKTERWENRDYEEKLNFICLKK